MWLERAAASGRSAGEKGQASGTNQAMSALHAAQSINILLLKGIPLVKCNGNERFIRFSGEITPKVLGANLWKNAEIRKYKLFCANHMHAQSPGRKIGAGGRQVKVLAGRPAP